MSSRNTCQRVSSSKMEKQWPMPCVYCHDDEGAFLKNGKVGYGRHHVKDCLKTKKRKPSRGRNKSSLKKEVAEDGSVWTVKGTKKKETKIEIPIVDSKSKTTSPKRVFVLKKESMMGYTPTPFKKGSVMSFSDIQEKFSNTDCWGDSDDDC